ncbi:ParA family protein [Acidithiobacillus caldus]|jgi:chromosome partitioning protein|uniref:ParA family protein n=1 Tax=Acidithiobacillus caldus TaxID=33059 RepID=UPI001C071276|nr:ParA family protein [Acidithiobacillus caldus]MBU2762360.1 ParA family protein [Acidithiobacillus caldus]MBU2771857.1 ParA family protein [Acidithiobacillus caldus]MBU2783824.1 ParA family protein [Acidithiobacillus caldus]
MAQIYAFANQKGGVGKTTLSVHLAILAHQLGFNTLLVDLDQQGSATFLVTGDGSRHHTLEGTVLDIWDPLKRAPLQESPIFGFDFLQASIGLDRVDRDFNAALAALKRLHLLESGSGPYDVVVIDCPPAPNTRQLAPLFVANVHALPVTPDALGTQGLKSMVSLSLGDVLPINEDLKVRILINRLKANSTKNKAIADNILKSLPEFTFPYILYDREDVRSALRIGKPYWEVCRDQAQKTAWYQLFRALLESTPIPDIGTEVPEPENADTILDTQFSARGGPAAPAGGSPAAPAGGNMPTAGGDPEVAEPEDGEVTHDTYIPDDDDGEEASAQIGEDDGEETSGEADSQDDILEQLSREAEGGTE